MIRRSVSKKSKKQQSSKTSKRKSKIDNPTFTCNICKSKGRSYSTKKKRKMEDHLDKKHNKKRGDGIDLKMFFEMLRVVGVIAIGFGIYGITSEIGDRYIESNEVLSDMERSGFDSNGEFVIVSDE